MKKGFGAKLASMPGDFCRKAYIAGALVAAGLVESSNANAQDVKGVMTNMGGQVKSGYLFALIVFAFIGVVLVGWGLFKLFMRKPGQQEGVGVGLGMIVGGALLVALVAVIGIATQSTVGTSADSGLNLLQ